MSVGTTEAALRSLTEARISLLDQMPPDWEITERAFREIRQKEEKPRREFRSGTSRAYDDLASAIEYLEDAVQLGDALQDIEDVLQELGDDLQPSGIERIKSINRRLANIHASKAALGDLRSGLATVSANPTDLAETAGLLTSAQQRLRQEYASRELAANALRPGLRVFEAAISDTIGLRGQSSIPKPVALYLAKCIATPRNLSVHF